MSKEKMIQIGDGTVDIVNNYRWSVSKTSFAMDMVPRIIIQEYQQNLSSAIQAAKFFAGKIEEATTAAGVDPYEGLYSVDKTERGNKYIIPYYSEYHHSIANAWGENRGVVGAAINKVAEGITEIARTFLPSAGIEAAKAFEGTQPQEYTFSFFLFNTIDPKTDIKNNRDLIKALINNNLLDKIDIISIRPPAICSVLIPGMREETVAIMSKIFIQNMGQINYMEGINVPDAYSITITIQELLVESRQILKGNTKVFSGVETLTETTAGIRQENPALVPKQIITGAQ